jgi:hypothetical protein
MNDSILKLIYVLGATQSECTEIINRYKKKENSANSCKSEGTRAADRITWIDNRHPEAGMTPFDWKWENCAPEGETSFLPEGEAHKLPSPTAAGPDQDGGSMRPGRGRSAVTPTVLSPVLTTMGPASAPPSNREKLDAKRNEEKCKILIKHNEILYSLEIEKETELYNTECAPYSATVVNRKKNFERKKEDIKKKYLEKASRIARNKPCKKN